MNRKYGIGAVTTGSNQWTPRNSSQWQKERARGEILPMAPAKRRWRSTDDGRSGFAVGLLASGLNRLRRFRKAASLTRGVGR